MKNCHQLKNSVERVKSRQLKIIYETYCKLTLFYQTWLKYVHKTKAT